MAHTSSNLYSSNVFVFNLNLGSPIASPFKKTKKAFKKTELLQSCSFEIGELQQITTMDLLTFDKENSDRIKAVENSFGASGNSLSKPGRVLMGEGRLMKQGRRKPQPKVFFLFNDVLVYGSIILNGRWHKKQKVIRLGEQVVCKSVDPVRQKCNLKRKIMIKLNKCMYLALPFNNIALLR